MTTQVSSHQQVQAKSTVSIVAQSLAALVFGMIIIFAVGFAPMEVAHNAAHDTRHGLTFPCH
jgi:cobalt transporter subunit CbtB